MHCSTASYLLILATLLLVAPVRAQEAEPTPTPASDPIVPARTACKGTCVDPDDMKKVITILKEKRCLQDEKPVFKLDPVKIVTDKEGRVFFSGADPHPYTVRMRWCHYEVEAKGKVEVTAAMLPPRLWGFRFRPKAYIGILPGEALYQASDSLSVMDVMDTGAMVDFLYYDWANLNAAVGFRSVGLGLGADITSNFGVYTGYALTWGSWNHNVNAGLWFSFYNPD